MTAPPSYFEPIREHAANRWDQLEADPELAGPWHQLFKQVQSPRHILSELLQNADDADATEATVRIDERYFSFTHNGEDFTEEHLASLCRFGYSNKRALHTIGFRGIGFKSTFSLGDTVELYTPTLSLSFHRQRFTEPRWIALTTSTGGTTKVRVGISDEYRQREVEKNLQEWLKSPVSLLFFRRIRRMRIGDQEVHWRSLGPGPVPETEWMALHDNPDEAFLIARSAAEPFPEEALTEIKQERLLSFDQDTEFPPCKVELVLGAKGRLYVVLPTGVETALPFACNAPFIQDPARLKIKDAETSPTNRWLLGRVGSLAASVMMQWLQQRSVGLVERSRAYSLFPEVDRDDNSLEGTCAAIVEKAFDDAIADRSFLLTHGGDLKPAKQSVIIPKDLFDVWPAEQASALLDDGSRPAFSAHASDDDREKLVRLAVIDTIDKEQVLNVLQSKHLPRPKSWRRLLSLWAYVAPQITGYRPNVSGESVRIVPVQGKDVLYAASEVVRLGEKRLLQSDADWEFLSAHLLALNPNWTRFLAELRREIDERDDSETNDDVEVGVAVLKAIGFENASDASKVIERVAGEFFVQESVTLPDCIRLGQIAAKLGVAAGESFRFATRDRHLRPTDHVVLFDHDGFLEGLFPESWCASHLLHPDYSKSFESCSPEEWQRWISSGRAGLHAFPPLLQKRSGVWRRPKIEAELRKRGCTAEGSYPYVTDTFLIEDWDFDETHLSHWTTIAKDDTSFWGRLVERILAQPVAFWSTAKSSRVLQVATTGSTRSIVYGPILPGWLLKLRDLPCLPDTRGFYRKPVDLLRRTPETEALMDVEPFIHGRLDTEATRPLLDLLGVRDTPTGPDRLLDCLRALSDAQDPPVYEVEKWYRRLDQMVDACSTTDLMNIRKTFRDEKLILTEDSGWAGASSVFLSSDEEDVRGAAVIRTSVLDLALWRKIGVAERPTADLVIEWLKELPSGKPLSQDEIRRVRALLARHAPRIWEECGKWLNLAGEWVPTETLGYALTLQSLVPWSHLHEWVKQKTADLQRLPVEVTETFPFSHLPHLAARIEDHFHRDPLFPSSPERKAWLNQLGMELCRIELDDEAEATRIRTLAADLAETVWQIAPGLEIIPYIEGIPAGTPRRADAVWLDRVVYIEDRPMAKLARIVAQELGRAFRRQDIADALKLCFDRPAEFVTEYVEENFDLAAHDALPLGTPEAASSTQTDAEANASDTPKRSSNETPIDQPEAGSPNGVAVSAEQEDAERLANDTDEDQRDVDGLDATRSKDRSRPRPAKPSVIERFASGQGFQRDGEDRFFHPDGSWIAKSNGERFPWERRTASGELVRYYWPKNHCLEREPLQLEADVWGLIDKFPETYALVLSDAQGDPVELTGARLRTMRDGGEITLYPATYRLVYDDEREV